jgi:hypothetical protein
MALTTAQAFNEFANAIDVNTTWQSRINQRQAAVETALRTAFPSTSDVRFQSAKLIGSVGRGVAALPISDIDILAHFYVAEDTWSRYQSDSSDFLYRVRLSLNNSSTVKAIGARGQAVRLWYTQWCWWLADDRPACTREIH